MNFDGTPLVIRHRVNTIEGLRKVHPKYGVEIDIRYDPATHSLHLTHDPYDRTTGKPIIGDDFESYMNAYAEQGNRFAIFNVKEMGVEEIVMKIAKERGVQDYFLLDEEFPFIYRAAFGNMVAPVDRRIAIRYSEAEPIEQAMFLKGRFDWVWVDSNTKLPLDPEIYEKLTSGKNGYKLALVCPERWGRPQDIPKFIAKMKTDGIMIDTVMTGESYVEQWENSGVLKPFFSRKS